MTGTAEIQDILAYNLETNSYLADPTNMSYVAPFGVLFDFGVKLSTDGEDIITEYSLSNIFLRDSYGAAGPALLIVTDQFTTNYQVFSIIVTNLTVQNVTSYFGSAIYINSASHNITIRNSSLTNNNGISGPKDLSISAFAGFLMESTEIRGTSESTTLAQSIYVDDNLSANGGSIIPELRNITFE